MSGEANATTRQTARDINARRTARAIDALRRGWAITISGRDGALTVLPVETGDLTSHLAGRVDLLIAASRAATLKLTNQRAAATPESAVRIALPGPLTAAAILAVADPVLDLASPLKGPFKALDLVEQDAASAAMELARLAQIMPAFVLLDSAAEDRVEGADIAAYVDASHLTIAAHAKLPVSGNENAQIYGFRSDADATQHIALIVGNRDDSVPVVRLHSECLTGDVLGSLKCDCGPQLHGALQEMAQANWGVLLYLRQEGRGIGLINKLRAYALQDQGFDTVDANQRLGFATDARDFAVAARMLRLLGVTKVRLLTNNPDKVAGLSAHGIIVVERLPLAIVPNAHNARYLSTKKDRTGHKL